MSDVESRKRLVDVIVVGAGLSGLTAAYHITKTDPELNICVLEAKHRVGGRTLTLPLKAKNGTMDDFDLGGHWVGRSQKAIMELLEELGLETYPQQTAGTYLLQVGGHKVTSYSGDTPSLPVLSLLDLELFMNKMEKYWKTVDPAHPYQCPKAEEWDNTSLETFIQRNMWTKAAKDFVRVLIRSISSMEPSQQSVLSLMMSVAGSGGFEPMLEVDEDSAQGLKVKGMTDCTQSETKRWHDVIISFRREESCPNQDEIKQISIIFGHSIDTIGEKESYPTVRVCQRNLCHALTGGTQQISKILAEKVGQANILMNHPVERIVQDDDLVTVSCRNGLQVIGQRLIIATPPPATEKITFEPLLPVERREINKRYVFGDYIKIIVTYEEEFWTKKGLCGEIETNGGPSHVTGCDSGPVTVAMDATSHTGSPALVVFIAGEQARQWGKQQEDIRRNAVLESLSLYFGKEALSPLDYCERDWSKEEFIGGALASLGTGAMKYFEEGIGGRFMRLHFAGTETAVEWDGNMCGAVEAGVRTAHEVLNSFQSGQQNNRVIAQ